MKFDFFTLFKNGNEFKFFPRVLFAFYGFLYYQCIFFEYWLGCKTEHIVRNEACYKSDFSFDD